MMCHCYYKMTGEQYFYMVSKMALSFRVLGPSPRIKPHLECNTDLASYNSHTSSNMLY